jgi:hypothetical protein
MRIGSSSLNQLKTVNNKVTIKGITPQKSKNFKPIVSDTFNILNAWDPVRGNWSTDGNTVSTSTPSSSFPILTNFDLKSQNILATMSLSSAGAGVVFWLQDENNWWAGVTFYQNTLTSYQTGRNCYDVGNARCWGSSHNRSWGCERQVCDDIYATRQVYDFYIKLIKSENGIVSDLTNILLRRTCSATSSFAPCEVSSSDNINGIEVSTNGDVITIRARNDSNTFYGSGISYTALNPNKGYKSGVIFAGGSNYLESSLVQDISIVEQ